MKARLKNTGEIVEVTRIVDRYVMAHHPHTITFEKDELDFDIEDTPDYWTRLEHQYAGMAMQGILGNQTYTKNLLETSTSAKDARGIIVDASCYLAHALVEKLKSESNG